MKVDELRHGRSAHPLSRCQRLRTWLRADRRAALALAAALLGSGCADCHNERVVAIAPLALPPGVRLTGTQSFAAAFIIDSKVEVSLRPCPDLDHYHGSLCMFIRAGQGRRLRFSTPDFVYRATPGNAVTYEARRATYRVVCHTSKDGERNCTSSEAPPTLGAVSSELKRSFTYQGALTEIREYSFDPTVEFFGAAGKEGPPGLRAFIESENWREYKIAIIDGSILGSPPAVLHMPSLWIDGVEFPLPEVGLSTATSPVCTVRELM